MSATAGFHEVFTKQQSSDSKQNEMNIKSKNTIQKIYMHVFINSNQPYIYICMYVCMYLST